MGVEHRRRRKECVDDRLHRRVGRGDIEPGTPQLVEHRRIGQFVELDEAAYSGKIDRSEPLGVDVDEIPAARLHVEHVDLFAKEVRLLQLHRGVAAAVRHEGPVSADLPRGVHTFVERAGSGRRVLVVPSVLHD